MKQLIDEFYPHATRVRVVMNQLNTHNPAALYEMFEPAEARRLLDKLEFHYTPKHGSWLNVAEIEFSVLTRQCLTDVFQMQRASARKWLPGKQIAIPMQQRSTGVLPPKMPVSS